MSGLADQRIDELLVSISAKTPAPGGGAVTGLVGAIATALARMVASYSVGSKKLEQHQPELESLAEALDTHRDALVGLADADARAYEHYNTISRLPEGDPGRDSIDVAAKACIDVPMGVIDACAQLMALFERLAPISNRMLRSDLEIAAILTEAVARASACNVRINLPLLKDLDAAHAVQSRVDALLRACAERLPTVVEACR